LLFRASRLISAQILPNSISGILQHGRGKSKGEEKWKEERGNDK
jgi:hypothetical protein